eukprot:968763-Ditylum_brightwellii.AAC.1
MPATKSPTKSPVKQASLFSFFNKKSTPTKPSSPKPASSKPPPSSSPVKKSPPKKKNAWNAKLVSQVQIGTRLSVLWPDDDEYYPCKVTEQKSGTTVFTLLYDDGEVETLDLAGEVFKVLEDAKKMKKKVEKDKKNKVESRQEETQK